MKNLLVVDDEPSICWGMRQLGESLGWNVETASSAEQALQDVTTSPNVIVLDVRLPGMDGLTALGLFQQRWPRSPVIIITAHGSLQIAVSAVGQGAFEYIVKPFDLPTMEQLLLRAAEQANAAAEAVADAATPGGMIGQSAKMQAVFKQIALAANSHANVIVYGESGTGKELAACAIHQFSPRAAGPFVAVNVAALNPQLAESELFGHVRGAFTGADVERTGLLVQAHGGTLFLDEVADIPPTLQVKLLRALEQGEVLPVGANEPITTDCRVITATHRDLAEEVVAGRFRHDLYFRLNTFQIQLPPLRERAEDIPLLAQHFVTTLRSPQQPALDLSSAALSELQRRQWHGNVRELRNAIEHAIVVARGGMIVPEHLPPATSIASLTPLPEAGSIAERISALAASWTDRALDDASPSDTIYERLLKIVEQAMFRVAVARHHGQCASAARQLGIHRTTLRKKLDEYGIDAREL